MPSYFVAPYEVSNNFCLVHIQILYFGGYEYFTYICILFSVQASENPCSTTICGPNSQCREINNQAVCSCLPTYLGIPPACRPECVGNSECPQDRACIKQKCVNPCVGACGLRAICEVFNHNPICSCPTAHTGDPFVSCSFVASKFICIFRCHFMS